MGRLMFKHKTQRHRWWVILWVVLSAHLILGYVWLRDEQPRLMPATASSDLAVGVRSDPVIEQTQGDQADKPADPTPRTEVKVDRDDNGLRADVTHMASDVVGFSKKSPTDAIFGGHSAEQGTQGTMNNGAIENETRMVDCMATHKPTHVPAGLDVKVRVERAAENRAVFRGLVNQQGEGSRYLTEVKQAVQGIRFIAQDEQCIGVTVTLTVRVE